MKRNMLSSILLLLAIVSVARAGTEAYKVVMSKNKALCRGMLKLFNQDMKEQGFIRYDQHEAFRQVSWEPVELAGPKPMVKYCSLLQKTIVDLNNDGKRELVVKTSFCLRSQTSDSLYIFPADSNVLEKASWGDMKLLFDTPNKFHRTGDVYSLTELNLASNERGHEAIGGVFIIQPFLWGNVAYISMTDLHQEWIVIAKYLQGEELQDICYFRGKSLS